MDALYYYKYHPNEIHRNLREGRSLYSGVLKEEAQRCAENLETLFNDPEKTFKTDKGVTLYRALQKKLSDEEKETLSAIGKVYTDKSFCSTSTDINVAKGFSCGNPILEINFPKNSKYINLDGLFNIDKRHWREREFLLNKGSKFLITGFDSEKNIIKCDYVGE